MRLRIASRLVVVMVNAIMLLPLELLVISFAVAPDWTPTALERVKRWFGRHWHRIAVVGTALLGLLLAVRGVIELIA